MSKRFFYNIWRENVLRNGLNLLVIGGGGGGKDYKFRWFVYLFLEDWIDSLYFEFKESDIKIWINEIFINYRWFF